MMRAGYKSKGLFLPQWHPLDQILGPFSLAVRVHELLLAGFSPDGRKQCRKSVMASYRLSEWRLTSSSRRFWITSGIALFPFLPFCLWLSVMLRLFVPFASNGVGASFEKLCSFQLCMHAQLDQTDALLQHLLPACHDSSRGR